ncbi:MAG: Ig-like domain-containing protein [Chloroflexota bacterium]
MDNHFHTHSSQRGPLVVIVACVIFAMTAAGCTRPADRPLDGARPGSIASANSEALVSASPLSVPSPAPVIFTVAPVASPTVLPAPSPTATGRGPIISTIQPPANANLPAGPITVSARISATSDVSEVTLLVNGQATRPSASGDARNPTYSTSMNLPPGQHQARIQVRDDQGRVGGFSWSFTVGGGAPASSPASKR